MILQRRRFLSLLAAPAIVRVASIMPILAPALELRPESLITVELDLQPHSAYSAFRECVEPILQKYFEKVYDEMPIDWTIWRRGDGVALTSARHPEAASS